MRRYLCDRFAQGQSDSPPHMGVLRVDADALTVQHELHATLLDRAVLGIRIQQILAAGGGAASAVIDTTTQLLEFDAADSPREPGDVVR